MTLKKLALAFAAVAAMAFTSVAEDDWTGEPDYYVEYVSSSGRQCIDLGVRASGLIESCIELAWNEKPDNSCCLGARTSAGKRCYLAYGYKGKWATGYNDLWDEEHLYPVELNPGTKYRVDTKLANGSQVVKVDGTEIYNYTTAGNLDLGMNIFLFNACDENDWTRVARAKCYSLWIWKEGTLVRELYPCVKNGEPCLFDQVSKNYFRNKTATSLEAGPLVQVSNLKIAPIPEQRWFMDGPVEPHPEVSYINPQTGEQIPLTEGVDYELSWKDNNSVGLGTVTVTGKNAYVGEQAARAMFKIVNGYGTGKILFVTPTGNPAADGSDLDNATTLAHACEIIPAGTASACNSIVLLSGTAEDPEVYDYSTQVDGSCVATLSAQNVQIRSAAGDLDPRKVVIKGGGDYRRFLVAADGFQMAGLTVRDFKMTNGACIVKGPVALATNCAFIANFSTNTLGTASKEVYSALFCSSAVFCNCDFTDNIGGPYDNGDTLVNASCFAAGHRKLYGCRFTGNKGAVLISVASANAWDSTASSLEAFDCTFSENVGGVLNKEWQINAASCTFTDCRFYGNRDDSAAPDGRRWCIGRGGSFERCEFGGNSADTSFGANASYSTCLVTNNACGFGDVQSLTGCVVRSNVMPALMTGFGSVTDTLVDDNTFTESNFDFKKAAPTVKRSIFLRNRFAKSLFNGHYDSAVQGRMLWVEDCLFVSNVCTIAGDDATSGSGIIFGYTGYYVAIGCTFADNDCGSGCAVGVDWNPNYTSRAVNCLAFGNKPYDVYGDANSCMTNTLYGTIKKQVFHPDSVDSYSISNPKFSRKTDALHPFGYSLSASSPARRAGRDIGYAADAKDLTGVLLRVHDGIVDVGCYTCEPRKGLILILR